MATSRYISTEDVEAHLELETLNEVEDPKLSTVMGWIKGAEADVDRLTSNRWDKHVISNELVSLDVQNREFMLSCRPLCHISNISYQNGDEWNNDWVDIPGNEYRIVNERISKVKTKEFFFGKDCLQVTYEAGYEDIPVSLKELTVLLVEKRYIMSRLGISAADSETVSVAVIKIKDKSKASLSYKMKGLDREIKDRVRALGKSLKAMNYSIGFMNMQGTPNSRYRI